MPATTGRRLGALLLVATSWGSIASAQQNRIDVITPLAPELAAYGQYSIGVRTIQATDRNRVDVLNTKPDSVSPRYDRTFTLEVWYPAALAAGQSPGGQYRAVTRDPTIIATLLGKAVRDAAPLTTAGAFPLLIISHGYPGNRYLLSHMGENLASKGYVVVSIDHPESTYDDNKGFASTLYNRPFDQLFVLNEIARLAGAGSTSFLRGLTDVNRTALIGYSMGGYGVVNVVGGGFSAASATIRGGPPNRMLAERGAANATYRAGRDPRIKAAIAIAPWGMQGGYWDAEGLRGISIPMLFVAGSVDDVAGYEKGTRAIFEDAVNADRYLLTFIGANHNAGAPIAPPIETYGSRSAYTHYADAVWDNTRMNNILDHFATAFLDIQLKNDREKQTYLDLVPQGKDSTWKGFRGGAAVGLILEHRPAGR